MRAARAVLLVALTSGCAGGEQSDSGSSGGFPTDLFAIAWIGGNQQGDVAMKINGLMKKNGIRSYTEGISATSVYVHEKDVEQAVKLLTQNRDQLGRELHLESRPHRVSPPKENP